MSITENGSVARVWIDCPRVSPSLEAALKEVDATVERIDGEQRIPKGVLPSTIVFCPRRREDVREKVRLLRVLVPRTPILVHAPSIDARIAEEALRAGASGFIHAELSPGQSPAPSCWLPRTRW